jgi:chaperonin GroES
MFEKFRPLSDRVLVRRLDTDEEITAGGIVIPGTAKEKPQQGNVVAIGAGRVTPEGKVVPLHVKIGDTVYFSKYAGTEADKEYLIIREEEILGIIEK